MTQLPFAEIEHVVSKRLGRQWKVRQSTSLHDLASHRAYLLSDGDYSVFVKFSDARDGRLQFETELAGLRVLQGKAQIRIPAPVGIVSTKQGDALVLEAVQRVEPTQADWRNIGVALARIHAIHGTQFGFESNGFIGPLPMDNRPMDDWCEFYVRRRLEPALRTAVASGHLTASEQRAVEQLIPRVPELAGPPVAPALLHGDAQRNNWVFGPDGPVAIDPAVYYGHPEMDLAFLDIWQPVPHSVREAYAEHATLNAGFEDRADLWRLWGYLLGLALEGPIHRPRLAAALSRYQ